MTTPNDEEEKQRLLKRKKEIQEELKAAHSRLYHAEIDYDKLLQDIMAETGMTKEEADEIIEEEIKKRNAQKGNPI